MKKLSTLSLLLLTACAQATAVPLSKNMLQITSSAAPACGAIGAQKVASKQAAVETIKRGYERYVILGGQYRNNVSVVGHTPISSNTTFSGTGTTFGNTTSIDGTANTNYYGGQAIEAGTHDQGLIVKMFNPGEPGFENAIPAKASLGAKWEEQVKNPSYTCL